MVNIVEIYPVESQIKPKRNRLASKKDEKPKGIFMSWKKKQERLLYQYNEEITLICNLHNLMAFAVRMTVIIPVGRKIIEKEVFLQSSKISKI